MKKVDKLILTSFAGPYILSFFIAEFVLIMQFLWKYVDDILGKGFTVLEISELLLYYGLTIIPMALPISILLASIMVFGDISEKYELPAFKSAGVSLLRVMKPAIALAILTCLFSLFASNFLKPYAQFQFKKRKDLILRQNLTLAIEPGVFNDDFNDARIRVGKKAKDDITMKDVLIYDHSLPDKSLINMIIADSAQMYPSPDGNLFIMNLSKGQQIQELERVFENGRMTYPMIRTSFTSWNKVLDMSDYYLSESDIVVSRSKEDMLNAVQLMVEIDSLNKHMLEYREKVRPKYGDIFNAKKLTDEQYNIYFANEKAILISKMAKDKKEQEKSNSIPKTNFKLNVGKNINTDNALIVNKPQSEEKIIPKFRVINSDEVRKDEERKRKHFERIDYSVKIAKSLFSTFDSLTQANLITKALPKISENLDQANQGFSSIDHNHYMKNIYQLKLTQQFSNGLVCILFLFIGAPLGSIVRKGGYGYPLLIAILFYILFIISSIAGEKLLKSESITGVLAGWLPSLVLIPFSLFFTYHAIRDVRFSFFDKITRFIKLKINKIEK